MRDTPLPIPDDSRTIDDPVWDSSEFDVYTGWVALSDEWVTQKGLAHSMIWPWDHSKGVYVCHAYHSLDCVVSLTPLAQTLAFKKSIN